MLENIGRLVADELFFFRLAKTTRPYFIQNRTFFLACRRLPEQAPSDAAAQVKDLLKVGT